MKPPEEIERQLEEMAQKANKTQIKGMIKFLESRLSGGPEWMNDFVDQFWAAYPRKENAKKAKALLASLIKKNPDKEHWGRVIYDVSTRFKGSEKKYIPHATTYLNGERWNDEERPQDEQQSSIYDDSTAWNTEPERPGRGYHQYPVQTLSGPAPRLENDLSRQVGQGPGDSGRSKEGMASSF